MILPGQTSTSGTCQTSLLIVQVMRMFVRAERDATIHSALAPYVQRLHRIPQWKPVKIPMDSTDTTSPTMATLEARLRMRRQTVLSIARANVIKMINALVSATICHTVGVGRTSIVGSGGTSIKISCASVLPRIRPIQCPTLNATILHQHGHNS